MTRVALLAGVFIILASFLLGLLTHASPPPSAPVMAARQSAPSVSRPGWEVRGSALYFAALHPPPPPPPGPPKPAPPPEPDIATLFRRDVGAILAGPRVLVSSSVGGRRVARSLQAGDIYGQGWRISALSVRSATLRRGRETRLVNFFGSSSTPVVVNKGH